MMYTKLKYATLLILGTCSCTKENTIVQEPVPVTITATTNQVKSIVDNDALPESYTIYASAYYTNYTLPNEKGNYFIAAPFRRKGSKWVAVPARYWPTGGKLDFLFLACEDSDIDIKSCARWNENDCAKGVEVDIADGDCLNSEILFATTLGRQSQDGSVPVRFNHAQSWLHFDVITNTDVLRIDSLILKDVYTGGHFRVTNNVYTDAEWSFRGYRKTDHNVLRVKVPGRIVYDILVPEQDACDIMIYYCSKATRDAVWTTARPYVFHHNAEAKTWFLGEKTVYTISFTSQEIRIIPTVKPWADEEQEITAENTSA